MKNSDDTRLLAHKRGVDAHRKAQAILRNRHQQRNPVAATMAEMFEAPIRKSAIDFEDIVR